MVFDLVPRKELGIDLVLEGSGKFRTINTLNPYLDGGGIKKVIVGAPGKVR